MVFNNPIEIVVYGHTMVNRLFLWRVFHQVTNRYTDGYGSMPNMREKQMMLQGIGPQAYADTADIYILDGQLNAIHVKTDTHFTIYNGYRVDAC